MLQTSTAFWLLAVLNLSIVLAQTTSDYDQWINPNGAEGDFAVTYTNQDHVTLSWKNLNNSKADLWLTSYDDTTNSFAKTISAHVDISKQGSFKWDILVAGVVIDEDDRFVLRFVPHGTAFYPGLTDQFASPGFYIQRAIDASGGAATSSTASVDPSPSSSSSTASSSASSSSSPTSSTSSDSVSSSASSTTSLSSTPSTSTTASTTQTGEPSPTQVAPAAATTSVANAAAASNSLSGGAIAGIVIGSLAAVALFVFLGWFIGSRRRRKDLVRLTEEKVMPPGTAISIRESQYDRYVSIRSPLPDPSHEIQGTNKQPVELDARDARRPSHEVEGSTPVSSTSPGSPRSAFSPSSTYPGFGTL